MDSLEQLPVLFSLGDTVIDASDYFFGPGNNGRDCIVESTTYEDYIVDCFFQNDQHAYFPTEYLKGSVVTTGIARYNNKYSFSIDYFNGQDDTQGYLATFLPSPDADFDFFIDITVSSCPKIGTVNPLGNDLGCRIDMTYKNISTSHVITIQNSDGNQTTQNIASGLSFFFVDVLVGKSLLLLDDKECFYINCVSINEVVNIVYEVPNIDIVSQNDQSIIGKLDLYSDLNYTLQQVDQIHGELDNVRASLNEIAQQLSQLDFNISEKNPFGNFSDLRAQTDYLLGLLNASTGSNSSSIDASTDCSGIFGSAKCYFDNFAGAIIVVAVVIVALIIIFLIIKKTKKNKKKGHHHKKYNSDDD